MIPNRATAVAQRMTTVIAKTFGNNGGRANVDVESDVCGFIPVQITALLQP